MVGAARPTATERKRNLSKALHAAPAQLTVVAVATSIVITSRNIFICGKGRG